MWNLPNNPPTMTSKIPPYITQILQQIHISNIGQKLITKSRLRLTSTPYANKYWVNTIKQYISSNTVRLRTIFRLVVVIWLRYYCCWWVSSGHNCTLYFLVQTPWSNIWPTTRPKTWSNIWQNSGPKKKNNIGNVNIRSMFASSAPSSREASFFISKTVGLNN